jgi:hypothetical protein
LIIGIPFFLAFIGIARVISLGEGRLLEAVTGERMPRRPVHPGPPGGWWARIAEMLTDSRTWTTLAYLVLMLPLGIVYFVLACLGIALGGGLIVGPFIAVAQNLGWPFVDGTVHPEWLASGPGVVFSVALGVVIFTALMHLARGIGRMQVVIARTLLVKPGM